MSRAVKTATLSYGSSTWEIESVPVGVPEEREVFDITCLGDTEKKFIVSGSAEKGEFDVEVLKVGAVSTSATASAVSVSITDDSDTVISVSFGDCYLVAVKPGNASVGDRKATQTLTFRPKGGGSSGNGGGGGN